MTDAAKGGQPMSELPVIRRATIDDAVAIAVLFHDTVRTINRGDYSAAQVAAWSGPAPDPAKWRARMETRETLVAVLAGKIVGFAELEPPDHIDAFYVHAQFQRHGVGGALLHHLEQAARDQNASELSTEASITARSFFSKHGFVLVAEQEVEYAGQRFQNFRMRKAIGETTTMP